MTRYASDLRDFSELLRAVADWKKLPAAIVEKDYYLTRALHSLSMAHDGQFVLKGGTSLSKGWQLLDRFSEDLDILVRSEESWGAARRDTRLKALRNTLANAPGLELDSTDRRTRSETGVSRTAVFQYHSILTDLPGLGRNVLFEAGYRGSHAQTVRKPIQSYLAEYATAANHSDLAEDLQSFDIELQSVKRTFVEKEFAVHAAYSKDRCANRMRHYYDLFKLCGLDEITSFIGTDEYRESIKDARKVSHEMFPDQAVPDRDSFSDSPAFAPPESDFNTLERHYKLEAEIFFSEPPSLTSILDEIGKIATKL